MFFLFNRLSCLIVELLKRGIGCAGCWMVEMQLIASLRAKTKGELCGSPLFKNLIPKTKNPI